MPPRATLRASFTVTDPGALRRAVDGDIDDIARAAARMMAARSPHDTGDLARGYQVTRGRNPAVRIVTNNVWYWKFVEYGTRNMRAQPVVGQVLAEVAAAVRGGR